MAQTKERRPDPVSASRPNNRVTARNQFQYGISTPQWLVAILLLFIPAVIACSKSAPVDTVVASTFDSQTETVTKSATASVLISSLSKPEGPGVDALRILPRSIVVDQGDTIQLTVEVFGSDGLLLRDVDIIWTVVDPRSGTIDADGLFTTSPNPGAYDDAISVTAVQNTASGIRAVSETASVVVVGEPEISQLASVAILPGNPTALTNQIYRMRAIGFDERGGVIPGVSFVWQVNAPALGRINDTGYLTVAGEARTYEGAITVTAVWNGQRISTTTNVNIVQTPSASDFLNVQILPQTFHLESGDRLQLRAIALDAVGELVNSAEFRWSITSDGAGFIDSNGAFIAGNALGVHTEAIKVEAVVFGESGILRAEDFASVVIKDMSDLRRLENVRVHPPTIKTQSGGRALLVAEAVDRFGEPVSNLNVSWEAVDGFVGEVDVHGSFIAKGTPGQYRDALRVTVEQRLGDEIITKREYVDVTITGTLAEVAVHPSLAAIAPGRTVHFSIEGKDESSITLHGLIVLWSLSDESVGTIDAFGNFTASEAPGLYEGVVQAEVIQNIERPR